ncbi:MAG: hypothetical protein IJD04_05920 [Desulfovibrionaceae bacterium]|nr:hypothetical protein [Desulfovibrionaceae bacterium]
MTGYVYGGSKIGAKVSDTLKISMILLLHLKNKNRVQDEPWEGIKPFLEQFNLRKTAEATISQQKIPCPRSLQTKRLSGCVTTV